MPYTRTHADWLADHLDDLKLTVRKIGGRFGLDFNELQEIESEVITRFMRYGDKAENRQSFLTIQTRQSIFDLFSERKKLKSKLVSLENLHSYSDDSSFHNLNLFLSLKQEFEDDKNGKGMRFIKARLDNQEKLPEQSKCAAWHFRQKIKERIKPLL